VNQHLCLNLGSCLRILSGTLNCRPQSISAAVAYIKESGVDELLKILGKDALGRSTVITGLDFYLTEPGALRRLIDLGVRVLVYRGGHEFHPKLYLLKCVDGSEYLIAGSANISRGAIAGSNIEANILTSDRNLVNKAKSLIEEIKGQSVDVERIIVEYEKKRNEILSKLDRYEIPLFDHNLVLETSSTRQKERTKIDKEDIAATYAPQEANAGETTDALASTPLSDELTGKLNNREIQEQKLTYDYEERRPYEPGITSEQENLQGNREAQVEGEKREEDKHEILLGYITESNALSLDSYKLFHSDKYVSFIHILRMATKRGVDVVDEVLKNDLIEMKWRATIYNVVKGARSLLLSIPEIQNILGKIGKTRNKKNKLRRRIAQILLVRRYGFNIAGKKSKLIDALIERGYLIKSKDYIIANIPLLVRKGILSPSNTGWVIITMKKQDNTIRVDILLKLSKSELSRAYSMEINSAHKLYRLLTSTEDQSADDEELARQLVKEENSKSTEHTEHTKISVQGKRSSPSSICNVSFKHMTSLASLPRVARKASSCKFLDKIWNELRIMLCNGTKTLSELAKHVTDHRLMEFIIYSLSREGILNVKYTGGYTRSTMPKPRKAWSNVPLTHNRREMAERLLFYLYTTGNKTLRKKRKKAFYNYIIISINQKYVNSFCTTTSDDVNN
jgi:hypothetical protein